VERKVCYLLYIHFCRYLTGAFGHAYLYRGAKVVCVSASYAFVCCVFATYSEVQVHSRKQRKKKAKLLGLKAARFRELCQDACGPEAFKPYTHNVTMHIEEMQLNCQYCVDYVGKARSTTGKS